MRIAAIKSTIVLVSVFVLVACNDTNGSRTNAENSDSLPVVSQQLQNLPVSLGKIEKVLVEQIGCRQPPKAGLVMSALLRNNLILETDDGGDGVVVFIPLQPMSFLGHDIVRLSGWQVDPAGGAMKPFGRGPGTPPPNFFSITVKADPDQLRQQLTTMGIIEASYGPDYSRSAFDESRGNFMRDDNGNIIWPRRLLVNGPTIELGDDHLATAKMPGAVTISCTADTVDFENEIEEQIDSK